MLTYPEVEQATLRGVFALCQSAVGQAGVVWANAEAYAVLSHRSGRGLHQWDADGPHLVFQDEHRTYQIRPHN